RELRQSHRRVAAGVGKRRGTKPVLSVEAGHRRPVVLHWNAARQRRRWPATGDGGSDAAGSRVPAAAKTHGRRLILPAGGQRGSAQQCHDHRGSALFSAEELKVTMADAMTSEMVKSGQ